MTWYLNFIDPGNAGGSVSIPESPPVALTPIVYTCPRCAARFDSPQARSEHFFVTHPYCKPAIFFQGVELSNTVVVINRPTQASDWLLANCERVYLDDERLEPSELSTRLADFRWDSPVLELSNQDAVERLILDFRIPDQAELLRLEDIFRMLFTDNELSVDDIRRFTEACEPLATARTYLDGVCQYLYGVLAKDQRGDTHLGHAQYKERFNRALEVLRHVDRPMARTIRGIINFSFNSFAQTASQHDAPALAAAGRRFAAWAGRPLKEDVARQQEAQARLPIDHTTDLILGWMALPSSRHERELNDLQRASANALWTAEDRAKAAVLWLDWACAFKPADELRRMARSLLNDAIFAGYAEQVLEKMKR